MAQDCFRLSSRILISGLLLMTAMSSMAQDLSAGLRTQLSSQEVEWAEQSLNWELLRKFYQPHYQAIWFRAGRLTERASLWKRVINSARDEGLDPRRYHRDDIEQYWHRHEPEQRIWLELLLSDALLRYCQHLRYGRIDPGAIDPDWHIPSTEVDAISLVRKTLAEENFAQALKALPPTHTGYLRLRESLARYRQLASKSDFPVIPKDPDLYWGMWHDNVAILRERLVLSGDLAATKIKEPRFFDQALKQAVERFQRRHGLHDDGMAGDETIDRMNIPMQEHVRQIELNMERWRWLPPKLARRYIMVNTASYRLDVIEQDKPRLAMRVITGTPDRPTPMVVGLMSKLIINPYWYVPKKLVIEDLIPKYRDDPDFFKKKNIRILTGHRANARELDPSDIDWSSLSEENLPYVFRQDPGPENSLGNIKFPFKNDFAIYLHDTPKRYLFDQKKRAFSAGCVRVENSLLLADYLMQGKQGWSANRLRRAMSRRGSFTLTLPEPIPIYLVYWTVWVGADNSVYFQKDIYERDRHMMECG